MPTTTTGVYEIVLRQTYLGETVFNVFHYLNSLTQDDQQQKCAEAFNEDIMTPLAVIQSDGVSYANIKCKNLTGNLADYNLTPTETQGDVVGADMAALVAASFRYNRVTKDTRDGYKRFAGMVEENATGLTWLAAYVTACNTFAGVLGTDITTVGGVFTPIILTKPIPVTGIATYNTVANVTFRNRVTTQNSRKPW